MKRKMNTTFFIIGCCNIAIGFSSFKNKGRKNNLVAYLNLILGTLLIIFSFTIFKNGN